MRVSTTHLLCGIAVVALVAGCSQYESSSPSGTSPGTTAERPADEVEVEIPSQAEANAEAEAEISEADADEVFEELSREIESDLGEEPG